VATINLQQWLREQCKVYVYDLRCVFASLAANRCKQFGTDPVEVAPVTSKPMTRSPRSQGACVSREARRIASTKVVSSALTVADSSLKGTID
jgi:hypothetical protein